MLSYYTLSLLKTIANTKSNSKLKMFKISKALSMNAKKMTTPIIIENFFFKKRLDSNPEIRAKINDKTKIGKNPNGSMYKII